jgi:hypothetical protein
MISCEVFHYADYKNLYFLECDAAKSGEVKTDVSGKFLSQTSG